MTRLTDTTRSGHHVRYDPEELEDDRVLSPGSVYEKGDNAYEKGGGEVVNPRGCLENMGQGEDTVLNNPTSVSRLYHE